MFPVFGVPSLNWSLKALWLESAVLYAVRVTFD